MKGVSGSQIKFQTLQFFEKKYTNIQNFTIDFKIK